MASAAIPVAHCRQGDRTESGLQGLTTPAEIASGAADKGFNCNTDIVGQYQGEGASWQLTAWKNCAYFDQRNYNQTGSTTMAHRGTVVLDVSNPASPQGVRYQLALAWSRDGDPARARQELREALRWGRPFDEEPEARRLSRELGLDHEPAAQSPR
jgi:hypothetical protein